MHRFWCARCGQTLAVDGGLAGRSSRCPACGYVQPIPEPADANIPDRRVEGDPTVREARLEPLAEATIEGQAFRPSCASDTAGRNARMSGSRGITRSLILESSRLQALSLCLVALSVTDLLVTFALLRTSHTYYEANPVARWFFQRWDMPGMAIFKFAVIGFVITLGEIIERRRAGWGRLVLLVGCLGALIAIWQGLRLYHGTHR